MAAKKKAKRKVKKEAGLRRWSRGEIRILEKYYSDSSTREVSAMLPRTARAIEAKANSLGLYKTKQKSWSPEEVRRLKKYYRNRSTAQVAQKLGRSMASVAGKAYELELHKTKKYLKKLL